MGFPFGRTFAGLGLAALASCGAGEDGGAAFGLFLPAYGVPLPGHFVCNLACGNRLYFS